MRPATYEGRVFDSVTKAVGIYLLVQYKCEYVALNISIHTVGGSKAEFVAQKAERAALKSEEPSIQLCSSMAEQVCTDKDMYRVRCYIGRLSHKKGRVHRLHPWQLARSSIFIGTVS